MSSDQQSLTPLGKMFFASVIGWLAGKPMNFKLRATPAQSDAVVKVVKAAKEYQELLNDPTASIETVLTKLKEKNEAAKAFKETVGFDWPL